MLAPLFILGITGICSTDNYNFHTIKYTRLKLLSIAYVDTLKYTL